MTQDEIIRMAREAGFTDMSYFMLENELNSFFTLATAAARATGYRQGFDSGVLAEREACAKVCDEPSYMQQRAKTSAECAAAIRARSEK